MRPRWRVLLASGLAVAGCGGEPRGGDQSAATPQPAAAAPMGSGTITGTVSFRGTPPPNPVIDMSEEPSCKAKYSSPPRDHQVVVEGGMLANAFVYVKSGAPAGATGSPTAVTLDQDGCLYHPRILGVMVNQPIKIVNSDGVLHNIKALPKANRGFNVSQPSAGMTTIKTFSLAETAVPLECSVHGWMHARVFVMDHPFFASSGADGSFTIHGLPPGTYTLEAWHEKLGSREVTVTLVDSAATASFTFGSQGTTSGRGP